MNVSSGPQLQCSPGQQLLLSIAALSSSMIVVTMASQTAWLQTCLVGDVLHSAYLTKQQYLLGVLHIPTVCPVLCSLHYPTLTNLCSSTK